MVVLAPNVTYVIATYAGTDTWFSLELHLQSLFMYALCVPKVQLHIVVVTPDAGEDGHPMYYQHNKWTRLFSNVGIDYNVVKYVGDNKHASYDQWIQGYQEYPMDDGYYIFAEDDYVLDPVTCRNDELGVQGQDVLEVWIEYYNNTIDDNKGAYMCTYAGQTEHRFHAVISNGIVNSKTMHHLDAICKANNKTLLEHYYDCATHCGVAQIAFSDLFLTCDIPVISMHEHFAAIFWSSYRHRVERYSMADLPRILVPIQFLTCRPEYDVVNRAASDRQIVLSSDG
jgi:hypothetical protein